MQIGNNMIIPVDANSEITVEFFILKMQLKKLSSPMKCGEMVGRWQCVKYSRNIKMAT